MSHFLISILANASNSSPGPKSCLAKYEKRRNCCSYIDDFLLVIKI